MDDAEWNASRIGCSVHGVERESDPPRHETRQFRRNAALLGLGTPQESVQIDSVHVLHGEVGLAPNHPGAEDFDDIRVLDRLVKLGLALQCVEIAHLSHRLKHSLDHELRGGLVSELGSGQKDLCAPAHRYAPFEQKRPEGHGLCGAGLIG